jgi:hypothetical protein
MHDFVFPCDTFTASINEGQSAAKLRETGPSERKFSGCGVFLGKSPGVNIGWRTAGLAAGRHFLHAIQVEVNRHHRQSSRIPSEDTWY